VTPGVSFLALRSDGLDKYAQADGRFIGKPGTPTGITAEGPALKGATNIVIGAVDHREPAYHPRAFREIYKFIAGREPDRVAIVPEADVSHAVLCGTPNHGVFDSDESLGNEFNGRGPFLRLHRRP
jgi:hypothetical protein